jgi:hypothetical protein
MKRTVSATVWATQEHSAAVDVRSNITIALVNPKHRSVHEYPGDFPVTSNLPKAEEQLTALDGCSSLRQYHELKEKIAGYKQHQQVADKPS